ncbi:hypothetical protein HI914_05860 [Erysiphe necator]|nr:hypothetical protein HI914_05860 [Erysiphe necator]
MAYERAGGTKFDIYSNSELRVVFMTKNTKFYLELIYMGKDASIIIGDYYYSQIFLTKAYLYVGYSIFKELIKSKRILDNLNCVLLEIIKNEEISLIPGFTSHLSHMAWHFGSMLSIKRSR